MNITKEAIPDLRTGWYVKVGTVENITIDGVISPEKKSLDQMHKLRFHITYLEKSGLNFIKYFLYT